MEKSPPAIQMDEGMSSTHAECTSMKHATFAADFCLGRVDPATGYVYCVLKVRIMEQVTVGWSASQGLCVSGCLPL